VKPTIKQAKKACEAAGAVQAIVVWFDEEGRVAVASYGKTERACAAVKPVCDAIADALIAGRLPRPT
jgi:hypothetical protein